MYLIKSSLFSLLFAVLSLSGATVPAQTTVGDTPANEGVCDDLMGGTPGLYGLCVAFCEAQDCEVTVDETSGIFEFGPTCKTSSVKLLEKYNRRKGPTDPEMPCVSAAAGDCQCWTSDELYGLASFETSYCDETSQSSWALVGKGWTGKLEYAQATANDCLYHGRNADGTQVDRYQSLGADKAGVCVSSLKTECSYRGF